MTLITSVPHARGSGSQTPTVTRLSRDFSFCYTRDVLVHAKKVKGEAAGVLLDYGPRSNAELITTHGFAVAHNPHETVPITLAPRGEQEHRPSPFSSLPAPSNPPPAPPCVGSFPASIPLSTLSIRLPILPLPLQIQTSAAVKSAILAAGNISGPFALSPRALASDSDLLVALRLIAATPTELQRYADAFQGSPLSARNERKWRKMLLETVEALLVEAEQETSAEEDRQLLRNGPGRPVVINGSSSRGSSRGNRVSERRRRAAILCRLGEKTLLRDVRAELNAALNKTA
ncbi:MAG: hypothetical protein SGPRY_009094 [Prymnesium sp.]